MYDLYSPTMAMSPTMDVLAPQIDYFRPRGALNGMHSNPNSAGIHEMGGIVKQGAHPVGVMGALAFGDEILQPQIQNYQMSKRFPSSSMGFLDSFGIPEMDSLLPIAAGALIAASPMLLKKNKMIKKNKKPIQIGGIALLAYGLYQQFMA